MDETLSDHERRLKALESMDLSASAPVTGEIDTAAILKQLNLVKTEQQSMRQDFNDYKVKMIGDLDQLRNECRQYTESETYKVSKDLSQKID